MTRLVVRGFSLSLDGYGAGPSQDVDHPLGVNGSQLHRWAFGTRTFRNMFGQAGGETGVDDDFAARGFANIGAWIMGPEHVRADQGRMAGRGLEGLVG